MTAMPRNNLQRNADYWAQRMKNMEDALLDQSYSYVENLDAQFRAAEAEIERQMSAWYRRFAANNDITLADAKRLLNSDELAEFRWTVEDYIKHGEENALTGAWMKELENASARVHISRLDALKIQLQQQAELLYSNQLDYIDRAARQSYTGSFYHTAYEVQKGLGVGWTMQAVNEGTITKVLSRPWTTDGQTFRDRCWTNKQSLVNSVSTQLTQMIIRGEAPDRAISAISKQFEVSRSKAGRLVMTESAYFSSAAQKDCFNALGVEKYRIVASFDRDTCGLCSALDGKVFKMSDYQVGLTAPPFHPWCRCCTAPYDIIPLASDLLDYTIQRVKQKEAEYKPVKAYIMVGDQLVEKLLYDKVKDDGKPHFPKSQTFHLCAELQDCAVRILKGCEAANGRYFETEYEERLKDLDGVLIECQTMEQLINLSYGRKYITGDQCHYWAELVRPVRQKAFNWRKSDGSRAAALREAKAAQELAKMGQMALQIAEALRPQ